MMARYFLLLEFSLMVCVNNSAVAYLATSHPKKNIVTAWSMNRLCSKYALLLCISRVLETPHVALRSICLHVPYLL